MDDKIGTSKTLDVYYGLRFVGFVMLIFSTTYVMFACAMVPYALGAALTSVLFPLCVGKIFGRKDYSGIWGIFATSTSLGMAIGAPLWGAIYDMTQSYTIVLYATSILIVISFLLFKMGAKAGQKLQQS